MKEKLLKVIAISCALLMLLPAAAACGNANNGDTTTADAAASTSAPVTEEAYVLRDVDYQNATFNIFNGVDTYNMIMNITADAIDGDPVNDQKFSNTSLVEQAYKVDIAEYRCGWDNMLTEIQALCLTNDDTYDIAYLRSTHVGSMLGQNYLMNLYDVDGIDIDAQWWDQKLKDDATLLNTHLYYLVSDASLMAFEGTWGVYFNKELATTLEIASPYDLVRADMWTLDTLYELASSAASLNGDQSYTFSASGSCVYGLASFKNLMNALMVGCNEQYCLKDSSDVPYYALGSSTTVYDVVDKITYLTSSTADGTYISTNSTGSHYIADVFVPGRALFMAAKSRLPRTK